MIARSIERLTIARAINAPLASLAFLVAAAWRRGGSRVPEERQGATRSAMIARSIERLRRGLVGEGGGRVASWWLDPAFLMAAAWRRGGFGPVVV